MMNRKGLLIVIGLAVVSGAAQAGWFYWFKKPQVADDVVVVVPAPEEEDHEAPAGPADALVSKVVSGGSGCPGDEARGTWMDGNDLVMDAPIALGNKENCQANITLDHDAGWRFTVESIAVQGNRKAAVMATVYITGQGTTGVAEMNANGRAATLSETVASECGKDRALNVNVRATDRPVTVEEVRVKLRWSRCR